jgi:hypothetical protein
VIPVAALYVERTGPYPGLVADWYDIERDARSYRGTLPVVAHPPCETWGKLAQFSTADTHDLAWHALDTVRLHGGVLEHPLGSRLLKEANLPPPDTLFADAFGGRTYLVAQGDYGHPAEKLTLLYAVRLAPCPFRLPAGASYRTLVERMHSAARKFTPPAFARDLALWAATANADARAAA